MERADQSFLDVGYSRNLEFSFESNLERNYGQFQETQLDRHFQRSGAGYMERTSERNFKWRHFFFSSLTHFSFVLCLEQKTKKTNSVFCCLICLRRSREKNLERTRERFFEITREHDLEEPEPGESPFFVLFPIPKTDKGEKFTNFFLLFFLSWEKKKNWKRFFSLQL